MLLFETERDRVAEPTEFAVQGRHPGWELRHEIPRKVEQASHPGES